MYLIVFHRLTVLPLPLYLSQLRTSSTIAVGQAMPACMTYIVISTFIKRYLKAKRARAPAYLRTLRLIKEGFPKYPVSTGILPHSLPEWAFRARPGLWRICLCPKVARIAEQKFGSR